MDATFRRALGTGYERLSAWAELLDRINVFPVADGDTGRNLAVSLAPLRRTDLDPDALVDALLLSARGNSGNIGARFLEGFLAGNGGNELRERAERGRGLAWKAVARPKTGTMLSLFDVLAAALAESPVERGGAVIDGLLDRLERSVHETRGQLAELQRAGVVDAGALGMFLFFEGFFRELVGHPGELRDVAARFPDAVAFAPPAAAADEHGFCVDAVLRTGKTSDAALAELDGAGESVVALRHGDFVKVHLHAGDQAELRRRLERLGDVVRWVVDDLGAQAMEFARPVAASAIHVMTDAAGSFTREDAHRLGVTLLDSYVSVGEACVPETRLPPEELYSAMRRDIPVSTSQASVFERCQHYDRVLRLYGRALYLCVGSVYTGNHATALDWKREHDPENRLTVVDTGAASGRLGIAALAVARRALAAHDPDEVIAFARRAVEASCEWIFLDRLTWLARGGRMSKTGAFFGDLFHVKPVVSPTREGAKKVAVVRDEPHQIAYALARLRETLGAGGKGLVLLEHSDGRARLEELVLPQVRREFPAAEVLVRPLSVTSGAHMGPGTWAVAALPETP